MNTCKNCNEIVDLNYCPNCGKPVKLNRIDGKYIIQEIVEFFFANKGMLYTIRKVLINPGDSVRQFIAEDRHRYVKPITFILITSLIYALVNHLFSIKAEDIYQQSEMFVGSVSVIFNWMLIDYPGYSSIITGFFVAFWIKLFFKKYGYNIFEIFILICFVSGVTTIITTIVAIIQGITHLKLIETTSYLLMGYFIWAIGQFFDRKKISSYIKVFISFILGSFVLGFIMVVVGTIIDVIKYQ